MTEAYEHWLEQSKYDLETAHAMFRSERYLYVLFCCQQAVEKSLKGLILKTTNEFPPRIHNLARLAEVAEINMDEARLDFLRKLGMYYIQT